MNIFDYYVLNFQFLQYTTDIYLAIQCFRLALVCNNDHAEAYNNLGLVELQRNNNEIVKEREFLILEY